MWPFKNKQAEKDKESKKKIEEIKELREFRDVGEKFNYIGIEMMVVSHCLYFLGSKSKHPLLTCVYKNNNGEIRSMEFNYHELNSLRSENEVEL